jgi:formylglycine-generating enzyme required for sulfatase activity
MARAEVVRLEEDLYDEMLSHEARAEIGRRMNALGDVRPGVGLRQGKLPDIDWCAVPVGPARTTEARTFRNERGEIYGQFRLEEFYIAKYPVTFRQFQAFVDAKDGLGQDAWWEGLTPEYRKQSVLGQRALFDNHPRDGVSWYQAVAFARWLNFKCAGETLTAPGGDGSPPMIIGQDAEIRLPTEWEWQYAAQGEDAAGEAVRKYPWGAWDGRRANTREARLGGTTAVGMYPHGAAWCWALDMSGNLWEWCLNEYQHPDQAGVGGHPARVLRGGAFIDAAEWAACAERFNDLPNRRLDYFGFRVVCVRKQG